MQFFQIKHVLEDYFGEELERLEQESGVQFGKYNVVIPLCKPRGPRSRTASRTTSPRTDHDTIAIVPSASGTARSSRNSRRSRSNRKRIRSHGGIESFSLGSSAVSLVRVNSGNGTGVTETGVAGQVQNAYGGLGQHLNNSIQITNIISVDHDRENDKNSYDIDVVKGKSFSFSLNKIKTVTPQAMKQHLQNDENKYIPESLIAQQLRQELNELQLLIDENENENENKNERKQTIDDDNYNHRIWINKICNEIIKAYDKLYTKYIDSRNAFCMIIYLVLHAIKLRIGLIKKNIND